MAGLWTDGQRARLEGLAASVESRLSAAPVDAGLMDQALMSGAAVRLGDFPDTPVRHRSIWWVRTGEVWRAVDDHAQAQFDEDAERYRLALASVDGLAAVALAHPVSQEQLLGYVARISVLDVPAEIRTRQSTVAVWAQLDAPVGCGAWAVAWPPGTSADWHQHGEAIGALTVLDGELEFAESAPAGKTTVSATITSTAAPRRVRVGECVGIAAGQGHRVSNSGGTQGDRWALSVHVGWLVYPFSCHDHVSGAITVDDAARQVAV